MPLAWSSLQTGHLYNIRNYGEEVEFEVVDIKADGDIMARHRHTLEIFLLSEITRYGKGKDFDLQEI
jgi:hypothetical protein